MLEYRSIIVYFPADICIGFESMIHPTRTLGIAAFSHLSVFRSHGRRFLPWKRASNAGKVTAADKARILKPITVAMLILVLGIASFLFSPGAHAADAANDSAAPTDPGFSPWVTVQQGLVVGYLSFFIVDNGAWVLPIPQDGAPGTVGFNDAVLGFTAAAAGYEYLDVGQTFSTRVLFSLPGTRTTTRLPTEGVDFFAQGGGPSQYQGFGHQVLGIYLTGNFSGVPSLTVVVHTKISDEKPDVVIDISVPSALVSGSNPVTISFTQGAQGHWQLRLRANGQDKTLTSAQYGATWNRGSTQGVDAVRYFTSQGTTSFGPLLWTNISVGP
jgi:hypothetical protein